MNVKQVAQHRQLRNLRWSEPFKSILKGWRVTFNTTHEYKGQCNISPVRNSATIYEWGGTRVPKDYILHEMLHIAFKALYRMNEYPERRECEESLIQYMCYITRKKKSLTNIYSEQWVIDD